MMLATTSIETQVMDVLQVDTAVLGVWTNCRLHHAQALLLVIEGMK